jgi:hypothetical protein
MKDESTISQNLSITTKCNVGSRNKRITNRNAIIRDILYRTVTFVMSLYFTICLIRTITYETDGITPRNTSEQVAYLIMFICAMFLLTDLLIDDEETD